MVSTGQTSKGKTIDFSKLNEAYKFTAVIPTGWQVEYVDGSEAINIYNPRFDAPSNLDKSQIFLRNFQATQFLTLNSVDILEREEVQLNGHAAVRYEIEKKIGVGNFADQPLWRSQKHKLVDVRYEGRNPSYFYVLAYNPSMDSQIFDNFINSLVFQNDNRNLGEPMVRAGERVTKKPFGIKVSPTNSPIKPERFSGYHTGVDFEILNGELTAPVAVKSVCTGFLREKKRASGYGGVAVQECLLKGEIVTVVYGHLQLAAIAKNANDEMRVGESFALLGDDKSADTDGGRKHLHLGIHKGREINISGYVSVESQLEQWLDAWKWMQ